MLRLTDKEISRFAKISLDEIQKTILQEKEKSLRWRVIYLAFFRGDNGKTNPGREEA